MTNAEIRDGYIPLDIRVAAREFRHHFGFDANVLCLTSFAFENLRGSTADELIYCPIPEKFGDCITFEDMIIMRSDFFAEPMSVCRMERIPHAL